MQNAETLNKLTMVYLYDEGEAPVNYRALSDYKIFDENFEFLAVNYPSAMTKKMFSVE